MSDIIDLVDYNEHYKLRMLEMVADFFTFHSSLSEQKQQKKEPDYSKVNITLMEWLEDHIKLITYDKMPVGFVHIANRGGKVAWIEDIYVMPQYRRRGIATKAIELTEIFVKEVLKARALCFDVVPRNADAIKLYYKLGYDSISIITLRKEFGKNKRDIKDKFLGYEFNI